MTKNYARLTGFRRKTQATELTPQSKPIAGREAEQHLNAGGGYSFTADEWTQLNRFVILGVNARTMYQTQASLAKSNAKVAEAAIQKDPRRVVDMVTDILTEGRAFKPEPGLFVLALVASYRSDLVEPAQQPHIKLLRESIQKHPLVLIAEGKVSEDTKILSPIMAKSRKSKDERALLTSEQKNLAKMQGDYAQALAKAQAEYDAVLAVRAYALSKLPLVAKTPTKLYTFATYIQDMRGWGRSLRKAFANWYQDKKIETLALHAWKYKSRDGWSHRDLMRLAHPVTSDPVRAAIFTYLAKPDVSPLSKGLEAFAESQPKRMSKAAREAQAPLVQIAAAEELLHLEGKDSKTVQKAAQLIVDHRLTHEAVPGHLKAFPEVWEALAQDMPVQALLRNLNKMTSVGFVKPLSKGERLVVDALHNKDAIARSKAHPMRFLIALKQYEKGHGDKGSLTWNPTANVKDALDSAFYASFGNVEVTNRPMLVAVDDSGSMQGHYGATGGTILTPAEAAAAMALVTIMVEPKAHLISFATYAREVNYSRRSTLNHLMKMFGKREGTDTSVPIQYVLNNNMDVDAVISYTDNNTWAGRGHHSEYLKRYERKVGHPVRFVNVAMEANASTDIDPTNPNAMELTGFDADTPAMISEFVSGRL